MAEEALGRRALGRGLAALIGDIEADLGSPTPAVKEAGAAHAVSNLPIAFLRANPNNPRRAFPEEELEALAASIRAKGMIQPILARPLPGPNAYEIIAGERRWRAAQRAGLHDVPVVVRAVGDKEALELAIVENVQRADLNPIEEAAGYHRLVEEFSYTQGQLADVIGKSRPHIANTLRLLKLPESVQAHLREGRLSAGHARALLTLDDPAAAAERIVAERLSVRQAEDLARKDEPARKADGAPRANAGPRAVAKDADTLALEKAIADGTGLQVEIDHAADSSGLIRIRYSSLEQLDDICRRLQAS